MSMTKEQQQALDDALVPREQRLTIGSCNYRLSTTFKPKEPTFQVALDVLSLTPFYPAFLITASVPTVYMQEFWATVTYQKHHIRFKMNKKSYSFDLDSFRNMLQMCPKLPGQEFVDPPFEEDILTFMRELGYSGNIKLLSDVKVDTLPQPWRTFGTIINKCLSGKVTRIDTLRLSRAQILWGLYHQEKVDYVYLLWELVFPASNTRSQLKKQITVLPKISQVIINSLHVTRPIHSKKKSVQDLPDLATGKGVQPKLEICTVVLRTKTDEAPKPSSSKRVKATAKVANSGKKRQPATRLEALSDIALTEAEQMKLAIERSKTQLHISQPSCSGAHEGTSLTPGVPDVPTYQSDDEEISWKSSDEDDDDEVNVSKHEDDDDDERTESDDDGDDFMHPKFSTHDDKAKQDEEVNDEHSFDLRVQMPSHVESTDDEDSDDVIQDGGMFEGILDNEKSRIIRGRSGGGNATQETEDTHVILTASINLEGQQQSSSVSSGFVSNMLNPRPNIGIDSIFNTKATSLVDVPVTTIAELPLVFATTLPLPPTPLIIHMKQTPFHILITALSTSLQDLLNFDSLFGFYHRLKTLETDFSEFKQTNQFAEAVSSIPGIVDAYLANKMNEAIKKAIQLQSNRLRDEAQAKNEDFLNSLDENIKKVIKDQVKQQVKAQVSKILPRIEKSALVEAYESDKLILDTYGDTVLFKKRRDDEDKDEEPSARSNRGSKRRQVGKEPESTSAPKEKTSKTTGKSTDGSKSQHKSAGQSPWLSNLAREEGPRESFDELIDTPLDFSAFMMNRLKIDTLTPELLAGLTFELMKGTCKSLVELEYFFEEVYKATTYQLDWHNPKGQQYPRDLRKPLPYDT
ncbi:hypothetical protein Tco_0784192 [Tanacetum coccineum]